MADKIARRTIVRQTTHPSDSRSNIPTAELETANALVERLTSPGGLRH